MSDIDNQENQTVNTENKQDTNRKNRKKRRIKNQILSFIVVIILIGIIGFGLYKGVLFLADVIEKQGEPIDEIISENAIDTLNDTSANEGTTGDETAGVIGTPEFDEDILNDNGESDSENSQDNDTETDENAENVDPQVRNYIDSLTTEQKVASLFIVTPEAITNVDVATQALEGTKTALEENHIGGIIYSSKNIAGADKFKEMIGNTKNYYNELYGINVWTFVQEEGAINTIAGSNTGVMKVDSAESIGESGDNGNAYTAAITMGNYLKDYSIDVNLGPVCSYKSNENSFLKDRAYSDDADITASMVSRAVDGFQEEGIISCLTAFPGEGDLATDTSNGTSGTEKTLDEMRSAEFKPFIAGIEEGASMIMISHITAKEATGEDVPCSLSSVMVNDVLKNELGFQGVIITDDMSKKAIASNYSSGEAAVMAINAGCDMILNPKDYKEAYEGVLNAVNSGDITEERLDEALVKIYSLKFK